MRKLIYIIGTLLLISISFSCNEDEWLEEEPLDFRTTVNSFETPTDFEVAVNGLYSQGRSHLFEAHSIGNDMMFWVATDISYDAIGLSHHVSKYVNTVIPEFGRVNWWWNHLYRMVFNSNVIIGRIDNEDVVFKSESQRNNLKAQAMFFRAYAYRHLGILWGDVPLVLQEYTEPKRDFTRSPVEDVWAQCISDLQFAVQNLPTVNEREADGRLTKAAARHLLTEIYINNGEYQNAINTATEVIDDPNYSLMTERFGSRIDEPGDVYWDLFRYGNQNRSTGNTEAIWVSQFEYKVDGGGGVGNVWPRTLVPLYWYLKDEDGNNLFTAHLNSLGGRGIGWLAPTQYMQFTLWDRSGPGDIRTSEHNIIRDPIANNPECNYFGQGIVSSGAVDPTVDPVESLPTLRQWTCLFTKVVRINNYPAELVQENGETLNDAAYSYKDWYIYRLAETYLLRAEAYLKAGDPGSAASDINAVRARANADPVAAGDVDIDYIVDERARELCWEEKRLVTLMRTDKFVENSQRYNVKEGPYVREHHKWWPIPSSEKERNIEGDLGQNPGY
jgi:hypothetical protein